jgi:hypothetical protein
MILPASVRKHFHEHQAGDTGLSSITLSVLRYGGAKSRQRDKSLLISFVSFRW